MKIATRFFWLIAIVVTGINFLIFKKRSQKHILENPELAKGYASLFRGYLFWLNIPWVIMGLGCTIGGIPSVWHFFRPRDGNPYVLAWFGCVFALWIIGTFWLFFRKGAETLARYPGAVEIYYGWKRKEITNPMWIKIIWLLALAGGIFGVVMMWFMEIPISNLR